MPPPSRPGGNADVCFVRRAANATAGDFGVGDFEEMLRRVAENVVTSPMCNMNRWVLQAVAGFLILSPSPHSWCLGDLSGLA